MASVPRSGGGSAVCARGGDTSSRRWLRSWPRFSTTQPHGDRRKPGPGRRITRRTTRRRSRRILPSSQSSSACTKSLRVRGPGLSRSLGRTSGSSGAPWILASGPHSRCSCAAGGGLDPCCARAGDRPAGSRPGPADVVPVSGRAADRPAGPARTCSGCG